MNLSPETRLSLIARLADATDSDAWTEFVQIYQPLIQRMVSQRGLQYADAVEVTQDVLAKVSRAIEKWNPDPSEGSFRGWLFRVTRNLTIDHLRRLASSQSKQIGGELDLGQIQQPNETETKEFHLEYERQLFAWAAARIQSSFKPKNWQAFWMTTVEGHSIENVARELDMNRGAVYVARSRVVAKLAQEIKERLNESAF